MLTGHHAESGIVCVQPNGVVLSPDGKTAYITDTGLFRPEERASPHTIYAYDVIRTGYAPDCPAPLCLNLMLLCSFWYLYCEAGPPSIQCR